MGREVNPEVIYNDGTLVAIDAAFIDELKRKALANPRQRCRFCVHTDEGDPLHEMLIVHTRDAYVRPHKHLCRSESFLVLEGCCSIVLFEESGVAREVVNLGSAESGLPFYCKSTEKLYHSVLIHSEVLVFLETTQGPFRRDDTVFPPWAPQGDDASAVEKYMDALHRLVAGRVPNPQQKR